MKKLDCAVIARRRQPPRIWENRGDAMAGSTGSNVIAAVPISFTDSTRAHRSVPLSALQFSESTLQLANNPTNDWSSAFNPQDQAMLLGVVNALAADGELTAPPIKPLSPAIAVTVMHPRPASNNIIVSADVAGDLGHPFGREDQATVA